MNQLLHEGQLLFDGRRDSWVLILPAQRFIALPRPETGAGVGAVRACGRDARAIWPLERLCLMALVAFWFGSLFWILWHLVART